MRFTLIVCALLLGDFAVHAAPSHPERDEDVTFQSGSITIAGTLSVPTGRGPFPAVVLLSGSGPQNRDSEMLGFRPFKLIADAFVRRGIAVLRSDDRGVGGSTGVLADATSADLANDALAAVEWLRGRAEIDAARIGLLGHSEGAIVAAIAAAQSRHVNFVVWMAGSAVAGGEVLRMQAAALARAAGASDSAINEILTRHAAFMAAVADAAPDEQVMAFGRALLKAQTAVTSSGPQSASFDAGVFDRLIARNVAALRSPWMRFFIGFDPATALARVVCPVFAAFGGRDLQVPAPVHRTRLEMALAEAENPDVTVRVYADANHLFMPAVTGQPTEYATVPKEFVGSLLDDIGTWIGRRH